MIRYTLSSSRNLYSSEYSIFPFLDIPTPRKYFPAIPYTAVPSVTAADWMISRGIGSVETYIAVRRHCACCRKDSFPVIYRIYDHNQVIYCSWPGLCCFLAMIDVTFPSWIISRAVILIVSFPDILQTQRFTPSPTWRAIPIGMSFPVPFTIPYSSPFSKSFCEHLSHIVI